MKYSGLVSHLGADGFVELPFVVDAETVSKAKYKAFRNYREAFRPSGPNLFEWFLKYALISIRKEATQ